VLRRGLYIQGPASITVSPQDCRQVTVSFDFDSAEIRTEDRPALQKHAECLLQKAENIRVEGHCDEKGTTAYNLALGERRAHAVRRFLMGQGIAPARLRVISYGEERPLAGASNDDAWAENRRAEIHLDLR
jgi:peptidoglycan-associated lipoprotein